MNVGLIAASTLGNVVERIGAYGGLASTIGLGVLALLYFAQAREVKRLREWAGRAPERAADIEQGVQTQTDVQRRVIAQPQTPAAAAQVASPPASLPTAGLTGEAAARAAAAAIVAARATHPPAVGPPGQLARPAVPPAGTPGSPAPASNPAAAAVPKPPTPPGLGTPRTPGAVPPSPVAQGGAGAATPPPGAPPKPATPTAPVAAPTPPAKPSVAAAMATRQQTATASAPAAPPAGAPAKPRVVAQPPASANGNVGQETRESAAARPVPPLPPPPRPPSGGATPDDGGEGTSAFRIAAIVGGAFALVLVVGLIVILIGGDDPAPNRPNELGTVEQPAPTDASAADSPDTSKPAPVNRGTTTTTILNGTTTAGLARNVATKLEGAGFKIEEVKDNVDQTLPETIVYYSDGNRRAAGVVARLIGVSGRTIQPVDRNTEVAGSGARVVVTVGADLIE